MRYKFKGVEIRTENAAKSYRQRGAWLVNQISQIPHDVVALDYGCGKFRYTIPLSKRVRRVVAVDSSFQIDREQQVAGRRTTLRKYAKKHLRNVVVCEVGSKYWRRQQFDLVLCSNVLSVIPRKSARVTILRELGRVLNTGGQILVSTQFRNTHFRNWGTSPNAIWVRDGWFVKGVRGASFYAIIPPQKLSQLCRAAGLVIIRMGSRRETGFVFATNPAKKSLVKEKLVRPGPRTVL